MFYFNTNFLEGKKQERKMKTIDVALHFSREVQNNLLIMSLGTFERIFEFKNSRTYRTQRDNSFRFLLN